MSGKTHSNPLTKQEIDQLLMNPYVKSATAKTVMFTEEFKELVYKEKKAGKSITKIFIDAGISPEILGESRIKGFSYTLNKKARTQSDFSDQRKNNYHRPAMTGNETVEDRVKQLENELAYTRQEVEFLKKLQMANMEAQKKWESKHRQK